MYGKIYKCSPSNHDKRSIAWHRAHNWLPAVRTYVRTWPAAEKLSIVHELTWVMSWQTQWHATYHSSQHINNTAPDKRREVPRMELGNREMTAKLSWCMDAEKLLWHQCSYTWCWSLKSDLKGIHEHNNCVKAGFLVHIACDVIWKTSSVSLFANCVRDFCCHRTKNNIDIYATLIKNKNSEVIKASLNAAGFEREMSVESRVSLLSAI